MSNCHVFVSWILFTFGVVGVVGTLHPTEAGLIKVQIAVGCCGLTTQKIQLSPRDIFFNDFGGVSCQYGVCGMICFGYEAVGGDNCIVWYAGTFQYGASCTDPYFIANCDSFVFVDDMGLMVINLMVVCVHNERIPGKNTLFAYGYMFIANDLGLGRDQKVFSYL